MKANNLEAQFEQFIHDDLPVKKARDPIWEEPKSENITFRVTPLCKEFLKEKGANWLEAQARGFNWPLRD